MHDKLSLLAEKMILDEKSIAVEKMMASVRAVEEEREFLKIKLQETKATLEETIKEKENAVYANKELQLEVYFVRFLKPKKFVHSCSQTEVLKRLNLKFLV